MEFQIELEHSKLKEYKFFVNNQLIHENVCNGKVILSTSTGEISIWFFPWKIVPIIRINNFLVNTSLAEIDVFDHKFDFTLHNNFFDRYHKNDIASREQSFFLHQKNKADDTLYDKVIGVNEHKDLVDKIKKVLNVE